MHDAATMPQEAAHEIKFLNLDLKKLGLDGTFEGYASLFDRCDLGADIVSPGAFRKSLAARGAEGIRMLFQHDPGQPIGTWQRIYEDARGLFVRGRIATDVVRAREVLTLMRAGAIDGLSIGFRVVKGQRDGRSGIRRLVEIDLWEISIVTFPMQPDARVAVVKSGGEGRQLSADRTPTEREFERWLTQDAGFTRSEARAVMRRGYTGLKSLSQADPTTAWQARILAHMAEAAELLRQPTRL